MATVEIAAVDPTRSFNNAAAQNEVANSLEMQATKPNHAIQSCVRVFRLAVPLHPEHDHLHLFRDR